ncbi:hypothetical protein BS17DRAFT_777897 [Gyrodon lividus]|nr:hypothetical protein BS17DRAFT_777897 [Gyrodon lividus]
MSSSSTIPVVSQSFFFSNPGIEHRYTETLVLIKWSRHWMQHDKPKDHWRCAVATAMI